MVLISVITPRAEGTKVLPELKKRENKQLHERVQGEGPGNLKTPFSSDAFHWLNSVWNFRARKSVDACSLCGLAPRPQSRVEETKDWKQMEDIQYKHLLLYSPGLFAIGYHTVWIHVHLPKFCIHQMSPPLGSLLGFHSVSLNMKHDVLRQWE